MRRVAPHAVPRIKQWKTTAGRLSGRGGGGHLVRHVGQLRRAAVAVPRQPQRQPQRRQQPLPPQPQQRRPQLLPLQGGEQVVLLSAAPVGGWGRAGQGETVNGQGYEGRLGGAGSKALLNSGGGVISGCSVS